MNVLHAWNIVYLPIFIYGSCLRQVSPVHELTEQFSTRVSPRLLTRSFVQIYDSGERIFIHPRSIMKYCHRARKNNSRLEICPLVIIRSGKSAAELFSRTRIWKISARRKKIPRAEKKREKFREADRFEFFCSFRSRRLLLHNWQDKISKKYLKNI